MSRKLSVLLFVILGWQSATAQFVEDFEDGNLSAAPSWTGDVDRWDIEDLRPGKRLVTRGLSRSDTLLLDTATHSAYGSWHFDYGYRGGPLSNFNQVRVVLWRGTGEESMAYYVLIGSNDRTLKLYKSDTDFGDRELVGSAPDDILPADSADLRIRVEHDYTDRWRVWLDETLVIEAEGPPGPDSSDGAFRLWVKHSATRGSDHWFDNIRATIRVDSDSTSPSLTSVTVAGPYALTVWFSEPVTTRSACRTEAYRLDRVGDAQLAAHCPGTSFTDTVRIEASSPLPPGANRLTALGIKDPSGNEADSQSIEFEMPDRGDPPRIGDLIINEIDFAPGDATSEFVEIFNRSPRRIDLSSVRLGDNRSSAPIATDPVVLGPHSYAVVTRDSISLRMRFPDLDSIEMSSWPTLNNGGDVATITHRGDTLDQVAYTAHSGNESGSLERVDPESPSDFPGNWLTSIASGGATPGAINSVYSPDTDPPDLLFVEQTSAVAVRAVFSEYLPVQLLQPETFELNGRLSTVIAAGEPHYSKDYFLLFESVESGTLVAKNIADATGNVSATTNAPVHLLPRPGELVINEILFEPRIDEFDGLDDQTEYIEIQNLSADPVSVNQCSIQGPENEAGQFDTMPLAPMPLGIPSSEYGVIVDSKLSISAASFVSRIDQDRIRRLGVGSLGLRNDGSRVRLTCAGEEVDAATYDPDWHHPHLAISRGVALERISPLTNASDRLSWTSSIDPSGGTPGRRNSVAATDPTIPPTNEQAVEVSPSPFGTDRDGFRDHTVISYRLRTDRPLIRVTMYNSMGRAVRHLTRGRAAAREGSIIWDGRDDGGSPVPTGIYIVLLEATDAAAGHTEHHKAAVVAVNGFN